MMPPSSMIKMGSCFTKKKVITKQSRWFKIPKIFGIKQRKEREKIATMHIFEKRKHRGNFV